MSTSAPPGSVSAMCEVNHVEQLSSPLRRFTLPIQLPTLKASRWVQLVRQRHSRRRNARIPEIGPQWLHYSVAVHRSEVRSLPDPAIHGDFSE
jgi:hypothetical protein